MIDYIDEMYKDLAKDLKKSYEQYPSRSNEYKIMMQDLSRGNARTIVPDIEFTDASIVQLKQVLYSMPLEYVKFFYYYYMRAYSRRKKMKMLGCTNKGQYYGMLDRLHSYTQGRLDGVDKFWS